MGMLFVGILAWLAVQGKTPGEIGSFAVACALPWTFRFVVAPLMDRYTYLPMGHKLPWVLLAQIGLVASLLVIASVPDPLHHQRLFEAAAFLVSAFGAFQDAATDALAVVTVPDEQQARANGLMGGARMIGSSLALAAGSWALNAYGFAAATVLLAALIGLVTLVPILLRERPGEKLAPWTAGAASAAARQQQITSWGAVFKSLFRAFSLKNSLLVALLVFLTQGAYNYFETLLPLFAVKISGRTNVFYSQAFATADLIGGMLLGGYLFERFGKERMIGTYLFLIIAAVVAFITLRQYWASVAFLYGILVMCRFFNAFAKIGVYAVVMQCCSKLISASQFTLYMTLGAVGSLAGATLIGPIKGHAGWELTFLAFIGMLLLAALTLKLLNINKQMAQMAALGAEEVAKPEVLVVG